MIKTLVVCDILCVKDYWFHVMSFQRLIDDWFCEVMVAVGHGG